MKVLVTGGAGYIGSVVVDLLIAAGHGVAVFDNLSKGKEEAIHPDARLYKGDLRSADAIYSALNNFRPEAVLHLAAEAQVDDSDPGKFFEHNVAGGINLLGSMQRLGIKKFVFASSASVYGEPDLDVVDERYPTFACNSYGESKIMLEQLAFWYKAAYGIKFAGLRLFNVGGATKHRGECRGAKETHIIPLLLDAALTDTPFSLLGTDYATDDGTCIRDYISVLDVAKAFILCLDQIEEIADRYYNVSSGNGVSNFSLIERARTITGCDIQIDRVDKRPGDPAILIGDSRKLQALGWRPVDSVGWILKSAWDFRVLGAGHP